MKDYIKSICFLLVFVSFGVALFAQKPLVIKGRIEHNTFNKVDMKLAYGNDPKPIASAIVTSDGTFTISAPIMQPDLYRLVFTDKSSFLCAVSPSEQIEIEIDANNLNTVKSVTGSPSMNFVKQNSDLWAKNKQILDSINAALQENKEQMFYNNFYKLFAPFQKSNKEIDLNLVNAMKSSDTLEQFVTLYTSKGKVIGSKVDSLLLASVPLLKSVSDEYAIFDNYISNVKQNYDLTEGRISGEESFYAKVDQYVVLLDDRHKLISNDLKDYFEGVKNLVSKRDSLSLDGSLSKKKIKVAFADEVVAFVLKYSSDLKIATDQFLVKAQASENISKEIFTDAQYRISGIVQQYQKMYDAENNKISTQIKDLLIANKSDLAVLMFMDLFPLEKNRELHSDIIDALYAKYPNHQLVKEKYTMMHSPANATAIGALAPELAFENPDGKILKLSDLRGKYVLIDFWASWCGPCRKENPNVVRLYQQYHEKGFEVFSVSLDKDKNSWIKAIEKDNLLWPNHVSDLKYWSSEGAKIYGVSSIPSTFLIDKDGRIIAKNLRGVELANKLESLFAN